MKLQENTIFANRYQLERLLGRGGFSEVWLAKDNWTHLRIALKVYAPGQGMDANGLQEFCGELANVFDLNHTNLLKPTHVDTWNDMPYLIMAYCSQGSLASKIGQLSEDQIWKLIHDVAAGLAYLHNKDVVHQDIKPDNILIDESGNYVITDFGISTRARSTLRKSVVGGTASGGTTAYMGPERFSRQPAPTKASDVWSFGAMVYEVVEGNVPFGEIGGGLQKGGAEIPYITANISDALKFTVYKMLSKDTWDRPTAEKLVAWSQAPQSIEIDYDLLTSEETPEAPAPEPVPVPEPKPSIIDISRQTQRFSEPLPQPKPSFDVSPGEINADAKLSNYVVNVTGTSEWQVKSSGYADWIKINNRDKTSFVIWCDKNKTGETRSSYVCVYVGDVQKSIHVTQPSLPKSSKAWVWWLIVVFALIIGLPVGINMHQQAEQERIEEQNRQKAERERQEDLRNTTLTISESSFTVNSEGSALETNISSNREWEIAAKPLWTQTRWDGNKLEIAYDYNPNNSNRQGTITIRTINGAKSQDITILQTSGNGVKKPTANIEKIWIEHDMYEAGEKGMLIHVKFGVSYRFYKDITVYAFFSYRDGESLKDFDGKYVNDGKVYVQQRDKATYTHCQWNDMRLFMPYAQLDFSQGTLNNEPLRLDIGIWDDENGKLLGNMKTHNFNVTW